MPEVYLSYAQYEAEYAGLTKEDLKPVILPQFKILLGKEDRRPAKTLADTFSFSLDDTKPIILACIRELLDKGQASSAAGMSMEYWLKPEDVAQFKPRAVKSLETIFTKNLHENIDVFQDVAPIIKGFCLSSEDLKALKPLAITAVECLTGV